MTFSLFKEVIMMKKLALVATGFVCVGLLGACSSQGSTLEDTNELAKEEAGKDYVVLSVVAPTFNGEKSAADFKNWYQSLDYKDFPVLLDSKGELLKEYGIRSYPSALFIASDGTLAKTHIGYMSKEDIVQTLKEMK